MKTTIEITGQLMGNSALRNAILDHNCEEKRLSFNNGYAITFPTKRAAKKALWAGYKWMRQNDYTDLSYSKYGTLSYDASRAEIIEN